MIAYRLVSRRFAFDPLSSGARKFGGLWNPKGVDVLYTAGSRDDAVREVMAQSFLPLATYNRSIFDFILVSLDISAVSFRGLTTTEMSRLRQGSDRSINERIGEEWVVSQETCALVVPSTRNPDGVYILLNPSHIEFSRVNIAQVVSLRLNERGSEDPTDNFALYGFVNKRGVFDAKVGGSIIAQIDTDRTTFDVFISHSSKDKESIALPLYESMKAKGLSPWLDKANIVWGDSVNAKISQGLTNSRFILVVITRNFVESQFCLAEYRSACATEMSDGSTRLLPLVCAGSEEERRYIFRQLPLLKDRLYVNWSGDPEEVVTKLLERILL